MHHTSKKSSSSNLRIVEIVTMMTRKFYWFLFPGVLMKLHRKFLLSSICRNSLQHRCICSGLCAMFRRWLQANRRDRQIDRQRKPGRDRNIPQHATNRKLWLGTVLSCLHCIVPLILIRRLQWSHLPACYQDKQWRQTWRYCNSSLLKVTVPS